MCSILKVEKCAFIVQCSVNQCFRIFCLFCFLAVEALTFPPSSGKSFIMGTDEALENELGLGELAGLTVANEADSLTYDVSGY